MNLQIYCFSPNEAHDLSSPLHAQIYEVWKSVWSEEYQALQLGSLHSDNFMRQDKICAFFLDGKAAAACCYRSYDLSQPSGRDDSWFAKWPADVLDEVCRTNPVVLVASAFCIGKEFRRQSVGPYTIKLLLSAATAHYFMQYTSYDQMLGSMRNSRGTNKAVNSLGTDLLRTIEVNGEPTDLVVFDRKRLPPLPADMEFMFRRAWNEGFPATDKSAAASPDKKAA